MKNFYKTSFGFFAFITIGLVGVWGLFFLTTTKQAHAANLIVEPLVIDHQGLPRDIIKGSFKVTNPNHYKTTLFAVTKNFDPNKGTQKFVELGEADLSSSLANWISVATIMMDLNAGETKVIPYEIEINLRAKEDAYHAVMFLVHGNSRSEAEAQISTSPQLVFNVTVGDDSKDRLQVGRFSGPTSVFTSKAKFTVTVDNTGNTVLSPKGEVRIYNRSGQEVASIPVNNEAAKVASGEQKQFEVVWDEARGFGRYKAQLVLEFGDKQFQTYQDSIFFRLLPWPLVLFIIMILSGFGLLLVYTVHRAHVSKLRLQEEHYEKLLKQKVRQAKKSVVKKYDSES